MHPTAPRPATHLWIPLTQLATLTRRTPQTLRLHIRHGHLRAEKIPGTRGWRVSHAEASRWAAQYHGILIFPPTPSTAPAAAFTTSALAHA